jgi:hypothetical protein
MCGRYRRTTREEELARIYPSVLEEDEMEQTGRLI